jgi:HSP20 family protein
MAEKRSDMALREERRLGRRAPVQTMANLQFRMLERLSEDLERIFDDFGLGRSALTPRIGRNSLRSPERGASNADWDGWRPDIDVLQRNHELIVRADLPGLRKEDVKVEVTDDTITIEGERRHEAEEERGGVYRAERSYGSFSRMIPLPEGAITDQARATFNNGVLEIVMPAPPEHVTRARRLDVAEPPSTKK